jgi:hypothetical protein
MATAEGTEINLTDIWLRRDPARWFAGIMSGLLAGAVMLAFAMVVSAVTGNELWYPVKIPAIPFLGAAATDIGMHMTPIIVGILVHEALCAFLGFVFAHFTGTNSLSALLAMGLVWGIFSWIFLFNLFFQSFPEISALSLHRGVALFTHLAFGLALTSVAFFDRAIRGNDKR